jgi:two-component system invasion response regulator UvrY
MPGILLVDDHPIVRQGCRTILEDSGIEEVHEAGKIPAAYRLYLRKRPGLIILDLSLQGSDLSGLNLISRIRLRDQRTPILVFSMHKDPIVVRRALDEGATGYLLKDTAAEEFSPRAARRPQRHAVPEQRTGTACGTSWRGRYEQANDAARTANAGIAR